ncbi:hypothetical protein [Oscillatoria sp. HE19RPO]|uniref:hypothetical protein n=1 Tax=Oscillatoria sp. HE19RPO TaxID=2954806 RepID=UPI0020C39C7B|nr:hypothetical protein [Oscillatoria sp. HE19RPO]
MSLLGAIAANYARRSLRSPKHLCLCLNFSLGLDLAFLRVLLTIVTKLYIESPEFLGSGVGDRYMAAGFQALFTARLLIPNPVGKSW